MLEFILCLIFLFIAGMFNGLMDTIEHHYNKSIFINIKNKKIKMWFSINWLNKFNNKDPKQGLKTLFWKVPIPAPLTDGWHFFKSLMIVSIILGSIFGSVSISPVSFSFIILILLCGTVWSAGFHFTYSILGLQKKFRGFQH